MLYSSNYWYKKNNVKYTTYYYGRNADTNYLNNAIGIAFNQKALINASSNEGIKRDK